VSTQHLQDAIAQNGRTARIGLRWRLWTQSTSLNGRHPRILADIR
jgi:hypothetical protein